MKVLNDGYYLSIFSCVDPIFNWYETSDRHDHNMSLWLKTGNNTELIHCWEFERITGLKQHACAFFSREEAMLFINSRLRSYQIQVEDLQEIIGTPFLSSINDYYSSELFDQYAYHALTHIFSVALTDTKRFYHDDILTLALDGGPDYLVDRSARLKKGFLAAYSQKGKLKYQAIPSPGIYWSYIAKSNQTTEGTLMALAYASKSKSYEYDSAIMKLPKLYSLNDLNKNHTFIDHIYNAVFSYTDTDAGIRYNYLDERFTEQENKMSMFMKIIQEFSIRQITETIEELMVLWKIDPHKTCLALSGGYTLNCPTNTFLSQKFHFKEAVIMPYTNDSGMSIGMGLMYFFMNMDEMNFAFTSPYLGNADNSLAQNIKRYKQYIYSVVKSFEYFTEDIENQPVIWFDGRAELGPRALGHRSILADPRQLRSKEMINHYKQRQWWRPVAPIIMEQYRDDWFMDSFYSPYMLHNFSVLSEKRAIIPAVVHLDGTCRIHSLRSENNPSLFYCMEQFRKRTGVPVICNTSLNDRNEPIIDTISQAINFALRKKINILYINGYRVQLSNHDLYRKKKPLSRNTRSFQIREKDAALFDKINPHHFSQRDYEVICSVPAFYNDFINNRITLPSVRRFIQINRLW